MYPKKTPYGGETPPQGEREENKEKRWSAKGSNRYIYKYMYKYTEGGRGIVGLKALDYADLKRVAEIVKVGGHSPFLRKVSPYPPSPPQNIFICINIFIFILIMIKVIMSL